jgi:ferredoxin
MHIEIFYFSGTGNSLHVAKELQKRIPETQLVPILSLVEEESVRASAETVGFVFPQYASTVPKIVHKFIEKLDLKSARYIFAIATRGRTDCWAFVEIDKILKKRGRKLDSYFVLTMPSGSAPLVKDFADQITEERIAKLESEMQQRLDAIQKIIMAQKVDRQEDTRAVVPPPPFLAPFSPLIDRLVPILIPLGKLTESNFDFYPDDKCSGCGTCERICLAQKIEMIDGRPAWQKKVVCHGCFACFNFCPEQSIQIKSKWYLKSYTDQNGRYHHPEITAKDIAGQRG